MSEAINPIAKKLTIRIGGKSGLVDLVHVFPDSRNELDRLDRSANAPQVDGILRINNNTKTYARKSVGPQDGASGSRFDGHCSIERHRCRSVPISLNRTSPILKATALAITVN
jgi:hypothetical protein